MSSDGGVSPPLDFLSAIPLETAGAPQDVPGIPLAISTDFFRSLVQFPSSSDNGQSAQINARIPLETMEVVSILRDWTKTQFPARTIWQTNADFMRSALMHFINTISQVKSAYERGEEPDTLSSGLIAAQLFNEQKGGELEAHAKTMDKAKKNAWQIARAIRTLMKQGEVVEAANMISSYVEGVNRGRTRAGESFDFWERFFTQVLFGIPSVAEDAQTLIDGEIIVDTAIIDTIAHVLDMVQSGQIEIEEEDLPYNVTPLNLGATTITEEATGVE